MNDRHQTKPYPLRMPDEMREDLKEAADKNHRSMNAEIVARLQDSLDRDGTVISSASFMTEPGDDADENMRDLAEVMKIAMSMYEERRQARRKGSKDVE